MSEEKAALPEKDDAEFATPRRARSGRALPAFAIILALAAAAGCAYVYWLVTQQQSISDISALEEQIRETRAQLQNARQAFDEQAAAPSPLQASLTQIEESVATLKRRLEQYENQQRSGMEQLNAIEPELVELAQQVQSLNRSVLGLASAESRTETDLVLREVAYLLRRAAMKLQLDDDKPAALAAYDQADQLLRDLDDAMSAGLRESILTERTTIAAIQPLDRVRITTQLQQLAQSTYDWPLKSTASMATEQSEQTAEPENDAGFWNNVSGFFSEMVVVRRAQPVEPDLMTPAEQRDVQKSIANAILSAKWAYLHQDAALYQQQLDAALQQSHSFHASGDHHDALQALLTEPVAVEWPPLGEALQQVNALQQARQAGDL